MSSHSATSAFLSPRSATSLASALLAAVLSPSLAHAAWVTTNGPAGAPATSFTRDATDTKLYAGTSGAGVFVLSADLSSWSAVNTGLANANVRSLATGVNELGGEVLLAGTQGGGVFASWNHAGSWSAANTGLTNMNVPAVTAIQDSYFGFGMVLFAGTEGGGVFRSNGGQNIQWWVPGSPGNPLIRCFVSIPGGDENDGIGARDLFAGTAAGVFSSTDGVSWWPMSAGLSSTNVAALAATFAAPSEWDLIAATENGVFRSAGLFGSWTSLGDGLEEQEVRVLATAGTRIFAGTAEGGIFLLSESGESWAPVNEGLPDLSITALAIGGADLFAATGAGVYRRPLAELLGGPPTSIRDGVVPGLLLSATYPNPFRSSLSVDYSLAAAGEVRLSVHDLQGRRVADLVRGLQSAGRHMVTWNGLDGSGEPTGTGVYFIRVEAPDGSANRRVVRVR